MTRNDSADFHPPKPGPGPLTPDLLGDRRVLDAIGDAILVIDEHSVIVDANEAAVARYGYSFERLVGRSLRDLRTPESLSRLADQLASAAAGDSLFETWHVDSAGRAFPVEVHSRQVEIAGERLLVSVVRDISRRLRDEAEREYLVRELAEANYRLDALERVMSSALGTLEFDELMRRALTMLQDDLGADAVLMLESRSDGLLVCFENGASDWTPKGSRVPVEESFAGRVLAAAAPVYVADMSASPIASGVQTAAGVATMFGVPLYLDGGLYGVLELAWKSETVLDDAATWLVRAAAERIMLAVANARLYARARRAETLSEALNDVHSLVNASFDLSQTMRAALAVSAGAMQCDGALLGVLGDGGWESQFTHGIELSEGDQVFAGLTSADLEGARSVDRDDPAFGATVDRIGMGACLALPLRVRGRVRGVLLLCRLEPDAVFDEVRTDYAARLADALALAVANVAEFEVEHRIAETLQEALLTTPSSVRGVDIAHLYRSATVRTRVGGDFYDVFELAYGRVGVVIGDVSGKGLEAAVLTSVIKDTIRAYAHDETEPAAIIARANVALGRAARLPEFASVFFAIVDTRASSMTYCCAGHPPAAVVRPNGDVRLLECTSPVIGAFEDLEYDQRTEPLAADDVVFLNTDGEPEARRPDGEFFAEERLVSTLATVAAAGHQALPAGVFDAVAEFSNGQFSDDIALVSFRLT